MTARKKQRAPRMQANNAVGRRTGIYSANVAAPGIWAPGNTTELKASHGVLANQQLYHEVGALMFNMGNILNVIGQGAAQNQRVGNRIFVKDFDAIFVLNNKSDRPNVNYRLALFAAPSVAGTDSPSELIAGNFFTGLPIVGNSILLHDSFVPLNQGSTMVGPVKERSFVHRISVSLNRSVVYNTDTNCNTRLIGVLYAYDSYGTLSTDNIGSVAESTFRITFTDL